MKYVYDITKIPKNPVEEAALLCGSQSELARRLGFSKQYIHILKKKGFFPYKIRDKVLKNIPLKEDILFPYSKITIKELTHVYTKKQK